MLGPPKETVINGADIPLVCVINNKCFDPPCFWPKDAGVTESPLMTIMELYWFTLAKTHNSWAADIQSGKRSWFPRRTAGKRLLKTLSKKIGMMDKINRVGK